MAVFARDGRFWARASACGLGASKTSIESACRARGRCANVAQSTGSSAAAERTRGARSTLRGRASGKQVSGGCNRDCTLLARGPVWRENRGRALIRRVGFDGGGRRVGQIGPRCARRGDPKVVSGATEPSLGDRPASRAAAVPTALSPMPGRQEKVRRPQRSA